MPKSRNNSVVFLPNLWQREPLVTGLAILVRWALNKCWGEVQTANPTASNWGTNQDNQNSNKCSVAASQDENKQKKNLQMVGLFLQVVMWKR